MGWGAAYDPEPYAYPVNIGTKYEPMSINKIENENEFESMCRNDPNTCFDTIKSIKVIVDFTNKNEDMQVHFLKTSVYDYHYPFVKQFLNEQRYAIHLFACH